MRLIDADALKAELVAFYDDSYKLCNEIACMVDSAPTIDAVPVVRCKDCIHYEERSCEQGLCHFWDCSPEYWLNVVVFNDFCSYGERKDGES